MRLSSNYCLPIEHSQAHINILHHNEGSVNSTTPLSIKLLFVSQIKIDTNSLFINKNNCRSQLIFATRNCSLITILLLQIQPSISHYKCYFTVHNRCWKKRNRHLLYKVTSVSVQGISNPVTCASNLFWSYKTM